MELRTTSKYLYMWGLFVVIGGARLVLLSKGALAFPDEQRYFSSITAISHLKDGNFERFTSQVMATQGRPGDAILRLIPASAQTILNTSYGMGFENPVSLLIPAFFNIIVSLVILVVFFNLSMLLFGGNQFAALFGTLIYSLLINSNIYIRHILPYDSALLIFLIVLYFVLRIHPSSINIKTCIMTGLCAAFAYTVYPGYYFFPVLILASILYRISRTNKEPELYKLYIKMCVAFGVSYMAVIGIYEVLARLGGASFLIQSYVLQTSVTQGSFEEGFTFLPKYLIEVEGLIGAVILICTIYYFTKQAMLIIMSKRIDAILGDTYNFIVVIMLFGFFAHAAASSILHRMVWYGRLLHVYMPFLILITVKVVYEIRHNRTRMTTCALLGTLSLYSFTNFLNNYRQIAYPKDVAYEHRHRIAGVSPQNLRLINETNPYSVGPAYVSLPQTTNIPSAMPNKHVALVNFCYFWPVTEADFQPYTPYSNSRLVYQRLHFLSFPAYGYEGYTIRGRELLKQRRYKIAIYEETR